MLHVAGGGRCSWYEFAAAIVAAAGMDCAVRPIPTAEYPLPARRPANSVLGSERGAPVLPDWRAGLEQFMSELTRVASVKLFVCGAAGFIGSTFVELRVREHGDEVTVLDALTYAGREENLREVASEIRFVQGAIEDPEAVAAAVGDAEAIVNFAAETHVDRSIADPFAFTVTNGQGTHVLLEAARQRGLRYVQVSTDEVYGSIETGSFTETSPLQPSSPVQRHQDRRRPARPQLLPHLRPGDAGRPRLQQLRAAPVPREADPADDPQRARRRSPPGVRRWPQRAQLALRGGLRPGDRPRPGPRRAR